MLPVLALFAMLLQQPEATLPPATAQARLILAAVGVQIYKCSAQDNKFAWIFQEPQADLLDPKTGQLMGSHSAGPTWTLSDGSSVTGKLIQQSHTGDATNIPWLLLEAHPGGTSGALSNIAYVRRSDTQGGMSSSSTCDAEHFNDTIKVTYHATYTFYSAD
jgi:hypothetical protein